MSHYPIRSQQQNAWVCTLCGAEYPSEHERDLHMAGNCKDSSVQRMEEMQRQQSLPTLRANTFSHPEYRPRLDQAQGYGYGYPKPPNTPPQPPFQSQVQPPSRPNYPQRPINPVPSQMSYPPTRPWDQPFPSRGYAPSPYVQHPHVHQDTGHSEYRAIRRRSFPDISSLVSPFAPSGDKAKVIIIWEKEVRTLDREVTYIDNIQERVTLTWIDNIALFQGNATLSQGNHAGSLLFPTSGEMQAVQPFEVEKKGITIGMVTLKLVEVKSPKLMESTEEIDSMRDKYSKMEREKQDLRKQIEGLHTLINTMKENAGNLKFKLDDSEKANEKMKREIAKLEKELSNPEDLEKVKKDIETGKIEQLEKELKSERESSTIQKQLIGKLNKENQTGEETVTKLKEELEQANKYKNSLEYKLNQIYQPESEDHQSDQIRGITK